MNLVKLKRIYESPAEEDGYRILIDRLWPRGVSKERAGFHEWAKEIAPSTELRREFNHQPDLMEMFKSKYIFELDHNETAKIFVNHVRERLENSNVTLLYAAKDKKVNHAIVLKEWLEEQWRDVATKK